MWTVLATIITAANPFMCGFNSVCAQGRTSASATINLTLTLAPSSNIAINSTRLDDELNAYRLAVNTITTGSEDAATIEHKFLVIDNRIYGDPEHLEFALFGNDLSVNYPDTMIVMDDTPANERYAREILRVGKSEAIAMAHQ